MIDIKTYATNFDSSLFGSTTPWQVIFRLESILRDLQKSLPKDFVIKNDIAIHKLARIEEHCVLKSPAVIGANVFVGSHAYLRGGVWLDEKVVIGPGSEIKTSIILSGSALAHFNFVGDSIIGSDVNMEAGSVTANHFNERKDKTIFINLDGKQIAIESQKFGALVGDNACIGANAVLSPGTILKPGAVVKRLELVEQCPQ
jgi:NDP-sugar pyrophosphorylase family protein